MPFDPAFDERLRESEVRKVSTAATMTYTSHDNDFLLFTDAPEADLNVMLVSDSCQVGAEVRSCYLAVPYALLFSTLSSQYAYFKVRNTRLKVLLAHYVEVDTLMFDG